MVVLSNVGEQFSVRRAQKSNSSIQIQWNGALVKITTNRPCSCKERERRIPPATQSVLPELITSPFQYLRVLEWSVSRLFQK
jgi:hypothetical protein